MSRENLILELHFKQTVLKFLTERGVGFQLLLGGGYKEESMKTQSAPHLTTLPAKNANKPAEQCQSLRSNGFEKEGTDPHK